MERLAAVGAVGKCGKSGAFSKPLVRNPSAFFSTDFHRVGIFHSAARAKLRTRISYARVFFSTRSVPLRIRVAHRSQNG